MGKVYHCIEMKRDWRLQEPMSATDDQFFNSNDEIRFSVFQNDLLRKLLHVRTNKPKRICTLWSNCIRTFRKFLEFSMIHFQPSHQKLFPLQPRSFLFANNSFDFLDRHRSNEKQLKQPSRHSMTSNNELNELVLQICLLKTYPKASKYI